MPSRLTTSPPPVTATFPNSAASMSVTATSRQITESHLLHPSESHTSGAVMQTALRQGTFHISDLILPPMQARQPLDHTYDSYECEPIPRWYSNTEDQTCSRAPTSGLMNQSSQPSPLSPINAEITETHESRKEELQSDTLRAHSLPDIPVQLCYEQELARPTFEQRPEAKRQEIGSQMSITLETSRSLGDNGISSNFQYELLICQQPIAARACGFGERDRRTIDPPPILKMNIRDPEDSEDAKAKPLSKVSYPSDSVVNCELWSAETDTAETLMPEVGERRQQRRLMGTVVASPFFGRDEFDVKGCFFPFPDLSCRTTGKYRLKFTLIVIDASKIRPGDKLPFKATVLSNVFEVYTAKTFPGMIESTELTKRLKAQGCLITVKRGHQRHVGKRVARSDEENDQVNSEDDHGDGNDLEHGQDKRQKT